MGFIVKKIKMPYGHEFKDAYFKINRLSYNDEKSELYFAGEFYVSKKTKEEGYQPLENAVLCELITITDKTINLYEYIYNYIKDKAKEVSSYTKEYIQEHNEKLISTFTGDGPIPNMINENYALFVDAIDDK